MPRNAQLGRGLVVALLFTTATLTATAIAKQNATEAATIRGEAVRLLKKPAADAAIVATLERGEAITITGDSETANGDLRAFNTDPLAPDLGAYTPIEVTSSGDTGWVREIFINPHSVAAPAATETPEPKQNQNQKNANSNDNNANNNNKKNQNQDKNNQQTDNTAASGSSTNQQDTNGNNKKNNKKNQDNTTAEETPTPEPTPEVAATPAADGQTDQEAARAARRAARQQNQDQNQNQDQSGGNGNTDNSGQ